MSILVNRERIEWPKATISESQLRAFADAPAHAYDLWQTDEATRTGAKVSVVADLRMGRRFFATPKKG